MLNSAKPQVPWQRSKMKVALILLLILFAVLGTQARNIRPPEESSKAHRDPPPEENVSSQAHKDPTPEENDRILMTHEGPPPKQLARQGRSSNRSSLWMTIAIVAVVIFVCICICSCGNVGISDACCAFGTAACCVGICCPEVWSCDTLKLFPKLYNIVQLCVTNDFKYIDFNLTFIVFQLSKKGYLSI